MRTWPKIKLVDSRGHTVTVFQRVPASELRDAHSCGEIPHRELSVDEIFDLGDVKPPSTVPWTQAAALIQDEFIEWFRSFYGTHGRMPCAATEYALSDSVMLVEALQAMLAGHGLTMADREEYPRLLRAAAVESGYIVNSCAALFAEAEAARSAGLEEFELKLSGNFHIVGAPRGKSEWEQVPRPAGKKATAYAEAELDRTGRRSVLMRLGHTVDFDGKDLPAWDHVQSALDIVAYAGEVGDTLSLTVAQLWGLVQRLR